MHIEILNIEILCCGYLGLMVLTVVVGCSLFGRNNIICSIICDKYDSYNCPNECFYFSLPETTCTIFSGILIFKHMWIFFS